MKNLVNVRPWLQRGRCNLQKDISINQGKVAKWSLLAGVFAEALFYLLGYHWTALGLIFGLVLILVNWVALSEILRLALRSSSPHFIKSISFLLYHLRFFLVVLIMFIVLPKTNLYFGVGTFLGCLIPKITLGVIICLDNEDEWWLKKNGSVVPSENMP